MCNCRLIACPLPCGKKAKAIAVCSLSHDDPQYNSEHTSSSQMAQGTESPSASADSGTNQPIGLGMANGAKKQRHFRKCLAASQIADTYVFSEYFGKLVQRFSLQKVIIWESKGDSTGISLIPIQSITLILTPCPSVRLEAFPVCQVLPSQVPLPLLIKSVWEPG